MKKIFSSVLILFTAGIFSMQSNKVVTLTWDSMPSGEAWQEVRIYDNGVLVVTAPCTTSCPTSVTFNMPKAAHSYTARSWDGNWESEDSNTVIVNGPPKAPTNLKK